MFSMVNTFEVMQLILFGKRKQPCARESLLCKRFQPLLALGLISDYNYVRHE